VLGFRVGRCRALGKAPGKEIRFRKQRFRFRDPVDEAIASAAPASNASASSMISSALR